MAMEAVVHILQGCWSVFSPIYFTMYFVLWWEYFIPGGAKDL